MTNSIIDRLPIELQNAVISYINRPSHLQNVCLTSKQWLEIARPHLCHTVTLNLENENVCLGKGFLLEAHPGHRHVRNLRFVIPSNPRIWDITSETRRSMNVVIKTVLQLLPEDTLEEFSPPKHLELEEGTFATLYTKQHKLKTLSLGFIYEDLNRVASHPKNWLTNLQTLNLFSNSTGDVHEFYCDIVRQCKLLRCLNGDTGDLLYHLSNKTTLQEEHWPRGKTPFQGEPWSGCTIVLQELTHRTFRFDHEFFERGLNVDRLVAERIKLGNLKYLTIGPCERLENFLHLLRIESGNSGMSLRGLKFEFIQYREDIHLNYRAKDNTFEAIHDFLRSFSTLEYFQLQGHWEGYFDLSALRSHSSTLKHIFVGFGVDAWSNSGPVKGQWRDGDTSYDIQWRADISSVKSLISSTPNLQQVALALPGIDVTVDNDDGFGVYGEFLDLFSQLSDLRILRILNWPYPAEGMTSREAYDLELENFASLVVKRLTRSRRAGQKLTPTVLCIGNSYRIRTFPTGWQIPVACYVLSLTSDSDGVAQIGARQVEFDLVKYEEPLWDNEIVFRGGDHGLCLGGVKSFNLESAVPDAVPAV